MLDINNVYFHYLIAEWDALFVTSFVLKSQKHSYAYIFSNKSAEHSSTIMCSITVYTRV